MLQKKVLGTNANSSTVLVKDTAAGGELRVLKRINVSSWVDSDVEKALEMYNAIAASDTPHMVKIYTAVLQNTFLSIVSSYCPGEELQEYIEEKLTGPLDEVMALQWLWNVARVVQRVHSLPLCNRLLCFYGPLLDRIFVVEGGEDVVVGLPLPRVLYFKWLAERESFGVALHHEYPPEVLRGRCYYTPASDIWQLGLVGMRLLSANTSFDHRSPAACSLITSMMNPIMKKRPTIEEVISRLQDLLREGDVRSLSMPDIPNSPTSYDRFLTPKSMLMDERTAATSQEEEFECLTTDISKLNEDHIYGAQRRAWRTRVQPSWYRRAMRQFEELQIMNSSPLVSRSRPSSPIQSGSTIFSPRGIADRKVATARDMQSESRAFRRQAVPALALGRNTKPRVTERAPNSARRVPKSYTSPNDSLAASARRPQKQDFGEKKRRLQAMEREAYAMHRVHENRMREIRQSQDDVMKHDIRRYIKQWREQSSTVKDDSISFTEQDGVAIFVPKRSPPPAKLLAPTSSRQQLAGTNGRYYRRILSEEVAPTEDAPSDAMALRGCIGPATHARSRSATLSRTPPVTPPKRTAAIYRQQRISPKVPSSRVDASTGRSATASALTPQPTTASGVNAPSSRNSGTTVYQPSDTSSTHPSITLKAAQSCVLSARGDDVNKTDAANGLKGKECVISDSLESTVNGLRGSLKGLLVDPGLYSEVMDVVDAFVVRTEVERCNPRFNTVFMHTLRKLIDDDDLLLSVVPMCAQMVSLMSLLQNSKPTHNV